MQGKSNHFQDSATSKRRLRGEQSLRIAADTQGAIAKNSVDSANKVLRQLAIVNVAELISLDRSIEIRSYAGTYFRIWALIISERDSAV
jgi:hypothetical protein